MHVLADGPEFPEKNVFSALVEGEGVLGIRPERLKQNTVVTAPTTSYQAAMFCIYQYYNRRQRKVYFLCDVKRAHFFLS